ncbi:Two subunits pilin [Moraxella caviae]|nr:Two subunits pilin [Moraxella caviae]VEW13253.1 Two subunits pilin [Moraxella caviae]
MIELMIVIVIIGVLALFAIPQFQNRTASAQVSRVVMETSQLRSAVDICLLQGSDGTSCALGWTKSNLIADDGNPPVASANNPETKQSGLVVTFGTDTNPSTIEATLGDDAAAVLRNKKILWERSPEGAWSCTTDVGEEYRTKGCDEEIGSQP